MQSSNGMESTHQACAACKHQRKKCTEKCLLGPFFPADKTREFQAVHKVFGVSNVQRMIRSLNEEDRKIASDSLVWEALCRQKDPVLGPYGEYIKIYDELKLYKSQVVAQNGFACKSAAAGLIGWNVNNSSNGALNSKNISMVGVAKDNAVIDFVHGNGNSMMNSSQYSYASQHLPGASEKARQEKDTVTSIVYPQQFMNCFNQQYYISDE